VRTEIDSEFDMDTAPEPEYDYGRVRWGRVVVAAGVATAIVVLCWPKSDGTSLGHGQASGEVQPSPLAQHQPGEDIAVVASRDLMSAAGYVHSHRTFDGYRPDAGTRVTWAHIGQTAVFARTTDGAPARCVTYSIVNGKADAVSEDPTLLTCSPDMVNSKVVSLDNPYVP